MHLGKTHTCRVYKNIILVLSCLVLTLCFLLYNNHKKLTEAQQEMKKFEFVKSSERLMSCHASKLKKKFLACGGEYIPDYENPRTLSDKIVYLLRNYFQFSPITTIIGTKYLAKKYIGNIVGDQYNVKLLGVWDKPEDIDWDSLPNSFVLKTVRGHYGQQVITVKDKSTLDKEKTMKQLQAYCDYIFPIFNEGKYPEKKRIIAEELLVPVDTDYLIDYKFFCSYGRPIVAYCLGMHKDASDCNVEHKKCSYFSLPNWECLQITDSGFENFDVPKPKHIEEMLEIAKKLSKDFPLIRIDMYEIGDRVLVGEITEDSGGGLYILNPVKYDFIFGDTINIPTKDEIEKMIEKDAKIYNEYMKLYM